MTCYIKFACITAYYSGMLQFIIVHTTRQLCAQYDYIFQLCVDTVYAEEYNYNNYIQCVFHNNIIIFVS